MKSITEERTQRSSIPRRQQTMKAPMSMMMFVLLGAVGFGIGGAIGFWSPLGVLLGGTFGGASLGLAFKDLGRVVSLALLGLMGLALSAVGLLFGFLLGIPARVGLLGHDSGMTGLVVGVAILGAVVGAALGLNFGDWRRLVALAVAGAVGFGVGYLLYELLSSVVPILGQLGEQGSFAFGTTIIGTIGGAVLGAALEYLESRKQTQERRPRVR